ncbi:MAG TPA: hypothetical protein PLG25_03285 [bacterium]|nr:hypothetical protein [bacterium]HMW33465.1 hypothetical protein [bacterium]HMW35371.1 hypothetical protein [bacterium]HMY35373.1 hypothetical protein [bacterium]HMZ04202.1 hypothetical protein [bacterium]
MISQKTIERLSKIGSRDFFITSLYLNLDHTQKHGQYKIALKDLLKDRRHRLDEFRKHNKITKEQIKSLEDDFVRIENYIQHEFVSKDSGKGLAIFSCSATHFWEILELPQPVPNHLNADFDPNIRILSELLCDYRHYAIALVDSSKAKIVDVNLGFVREVWSVEHAITGKTKFGGVDGTQERNAERAHDESVHKHFKVVATEVEKVFDHSDHMWLILGGRQNFLPQFESLLPAPVRKKIVGHIVIDPEASLNEVLGKAYTIAEEAEAAHEKEIIEQLRGEASNGGKGIFGLQPTLQSLRKGGVSTLVVTKGYQAPGFVCHKCFFIGTPEEKGKHDTCPICSGPAHNVEDVVEEAITFAYMQGCKVETTNENSRMRIMGDFGALLRY